MIKYIAKITQNGANDPSVVEIRGVFPILHSWTYGSQVGELIGTANSPCWNSDMPPLWFTCDSQGARFSVSQVNTVTLVINAYDYQGNPSDGVMSGAYMEAVNFGN